MNVFKHFFLLAKGFFFPAVCALCGGSLICAQEIKYGLCEMCAESLPPVDKGSRCNICGKPLISEKELCLSCRNGSGKSTERLWVLFPYTGKFRKLLTEYKFRKNLALADFFAQKALTVLLSEPELKNACIVPVPPRPGKIKENGWDQVDFLVRRIEKISDERIFNEKNSDGKISVRHCLKRYKSKIQKRLDRSDRMENLKGRIRMNGTAPKAAVIIDDIITTGSTIEVCSSVLKEAGAEKVYGLCLFYD